MRSRASSSGDSAAPAWPVTAPAVLLLGSLQGILIGGIWLLSNRRSRAPEPQAEPRSVDDNIPLSAIPFGPFLTLVALEWVFTRNLLLDLWSRLRASFI